MIVELSGAEHHHLSRVSRHQSGDAIKLNNGSGLLALGRITEIGKNSTMIEVMAQIPVQAVPDYAIAFALLKSQNDELLVEKCTELGASAFFPFVSEFTIRKPSPN
ncbi:MAG TPA: RsmE family RNA methyltransferase, partial [Candidatus Cloacimonadota bacterium]|nr:RsmE family RNA methyltransferase [Candidatus Cloacimonadota bacterium]